MADDRTPEQKSADLALTKAIEDALAAYGVLTITDSDDESLVGSPLMLTDYVVLYSVEGFSSDGDGLSNVRWLIKDDGMPWHRIFGLHATAGERMRMDYWSLNGFDRS